MTLIALTCATESIVGLRIASFVMLSFDVELVVRCGHPAIQSRIYLADHPPPSTSPVTRLPRPRCSVLSDYKLHCRYVVQYLLSPCKIRLRPLGVGVCSRSDGMDVRYNAIRPSPEVRSAHLKSQLGTLTSDKKTLDLPGTAP